MAFFVIGDDGQKYGPADIETLNQWIGEGRLVRTQMLEDEASGNRLAASAVAGLNFPAPGPQPGPAGPLPGSPGYAGAYPRAGGYVGDDGSADLRNAWICGVIGLCCCWPVGIVGIVMANRAAAKGNSGANAARIFIIVTLLISISWSIYSLMNFLHRGSAPPTFPAR